MFVYDENFRQNIREINGIVFGCEDIKPEYDSVAEHLASIYPEKLPGIVEAMIPDLIEFYGDEIKDITTDEAIKRLGKPLIDLDIDLINFYDHTFDSIHIISVEYRGDFEDISGISVDG